MSPPEKQINSTLYVNLWGGPGSGKSTTAAGVFYLLKSKGVNCELITEYAKDKVWDKHHAIFDNQLYITTKQYHRQFRLMGQVDIAITDSPLLLSVHYNKVGLTSKPGIVNHFDGLVTALFNEFDNINFFLNRTKEYNPKGRYQSENEARQIDLDLLSLLSTHNVPFETINGNMAAPVIIVNKVLSTLTGDKTIGD